MREQHVHIFKASTRSFRKSQKEFPFVCYAFDLAEAAGGLLAIGSRNEMVMLKLVNGLKWPLLVDPNPESATWKIPSGSAFAHIQT